MQTLISTTKVNDFLWTVDYINESVGKCLFSGSEDDCERFYDDVLSIVSSLDFDKVKAIRSLNEWQNAK
jgi:hypothetical protein